MYLHEVLHEGEGDVGILGTLVEAVAAHAQAEHSLIFKRVEEGRRRWATVTTCMAEAGTRRMT